MYIIICNIDDQCKFNAWSQSLKAVALGWPWGGRPEGWDGEGEGRGVPDGEHMHTHGWFMSMYGQNHYKTVKELASN